MEFQPGEQVTSLNPNRNPLTRCLCLDRLIRILGDAHLCGGTHFPSVQTGQRQVSGNVVASTAALIAAGRDGTEGATIEIAARTFELEAPLALKPRMTLNSAGMDKTILTHAAGWNPSTRTLPDPEMTTKGMYTQAYLIRLKDKAANVTISDSLKLSRALSHHCMKESNTPGSRWRGGSANRFSGTLPLLVSSRFWRKAWSSKKSSAE